jgi:hypothetical protein
MLMEQYSKLDTQAQTVPPTVYRLKNGKEVTYTNLCNYQLMNGEWTDKLLSLLKDAPTLYQLLALQTDEEVKKLPQEVILTLVGIKLLKTKFIADQKEWRIAVDKGIQLIKKFMVNDSVNIEQLLDKLVLETDF